MPVSYSASLAYCCFATCKSNQSLKTASTCANVFPLEKSQQSRILWCPTWSWLRLLVWPHSVGSFKNSREDAYACLAVEVLQCGEPWVKAEVVRLLQARLRPGSEPLLLLCVCQSSSHGQSTLKGKRKRYHPSFLFWQYLGIANLGSHAC